MLKKLKQLRKSKRGAVFLLAAIIIFISTMLFLTMMEITKAYTIKFNVETYIYRCANNAVEDNIDYTWRQDGFNYLNTDDAIKEFVANVNDYANTKNELPSDISGIVDASTLEAYGTSYNTDGSYLYSFCVEDITATRGDKVGEVAEMTCKGTIYFAPSMSSDYINVFAFKMPFEITATNVRTDS